MFIICSTNNKPRCCITYLGDLLANSYVLIRAFSLFSVISSNQLQPGSTSASVISNKPSISTSKSNFSYQRSTTSSNNEQPSKSYVNQFETCYRQHLNKSLIVGTISCVRIIYGLFNTLICFIYCPIFSTRLVASAYLRPRGYTFVEAKAIRRASY